MTTRLRNETAQDTEMLCLDSSLRDVLQRYSRRIRAGHEMCGFFLGTRRADRTEVIAVLPVRNSRQRPGSFAISRIERQRAVRRARRLGLELLAIFHSHPCGSAKLSTGDLESIEYSDLPWILVTFDQEARNRDGQMQLSAFAAGTATPLPVTWNAC